MDKLWNCEFRPMVACVESFDIPFGIGLLLDVLLRVPTRGFGPIENIEDATRSSDLPRLRSAVPGVVVARSPLLSFLVIVMVDARLISTRGCPWSLR